MLLPMDLNLLAAALLLLFVAALAAAELYIRRLRAPLTFTSKGGRFTTSTGLEVRPGDLIKVSGAGDPAINGVCVVTSSGGVTRRLVTRCVRAGWVVAAVGALLLLWSTRT